MKKNGSRIPPVPKKLTAAVRFDGRDLLNPFNEKLHSFPSDVYQPNTAKVRVSGAGTFPTPNGCFVMLTSPQANSNVDTTMSDCYIHNGTASGNVMVANPWAITANSTESWRRVSAVYELRYTGRADAAAGVLHINVGAPPTAFDTSAELDITSEITSFHTSAFGPDSWSISVGELAEKGVLTILPRPCSRSAEMFTDVGFSWPAALTSQPGISSPLDSWEIVSITGLGIDASSSFEVRIHETVEVRTGTSSPMSYFKTPYIAPVRQLGTQSLYKTFHDAMLKTMGMMPMSGTERAAAFFLPPLAQAAARTLLSAVSARAAAPAALALTL